MMTRMTAVVVAAVALVLALPALLVALHVVREVAVRRRPLRAVLLGKGLLIGIALILVGYAAVVYAIGFAAGIYVLDPDQMCASAAGFYSGRSGPPDSSWVAIDANNFPLHRTCRWADGTTHELVPGWVNPLSYALLAGAWVALLARPIAAVVAPARPSPGRV